MRVRVDTDWSSWRREVTERALEVAEGLYKRHGALALRDAFEAPVTLERDESILAPVAPARRLGADADEDEGFLLLTDRRLVFAGERLRVEVPLARVDRLECDDETLVARACNGAEALRVALPPAVPLLFRSTLDRLRAHASWSREWLEDAALPEGTRILRRGDARGF